MTLSVTQLAPSGKFAPSCSESDLVAAVRRGDDRAYEELYYRYRGRISSYVLGMVGDHGRSEDIAQEVFISALRRLRDTERPIAFKPWIYEIAKNACIDEFRRTKRAHEVPLQVDDDLSGNDRAVLSSVPTPEAAVESKQRLGDLCGAFGGLSESHHKVLVLRELEGLSYSEIGERMGMSRPMVESTLFRARRRLSEEYDELASGRRCDHVQTAIDAGEGKSLRSLGIRERRRLSRHLAHCEPCKRHALMAGFDIASLKPRSLAAKIAALIPFPLLRWPRSGRDVNATAGSGSHQLTALRSLQNLARLGDPAVPSVGLGRAVAAVAALAIAGGGGIVAGLANHPRATSAGSAGTLHAARHGGLRSLPGGGAASVARSVKSGSRGRGSASTATATARSIDRTASTAVPRVASSRPTRASTAPGAPSAGEKGTSRSTGASHPSTSGSLLGAVHVPSTKGLSGAAGTVGSSLPGTLRSVASKVLTPVVPAGGLPTAPSVDLPSVPKLPDPAAGAVAKVQLPSLP